MTAARGERPSAQDAERALASLLFAMKQQASSPATGAGSGGGGGGGGGTVHHSSPMPMPTAPSLAQSSPSYTPGAGSSAAPTPAAAAPGTTTLSSQMNTQELLLALLGQAMAAQHTTQRAGPPSTARAEFSRGEPSTTGARSDPSAAPPVSAALGDHTNADPAPGSVYHPQPTRSGRMPQAPTESSVDPATLLFNNYFDFPSSDDEEDDPDFDPNAPVEDFWGDLLAGEKGDGGWTEDEGEWGTNGGGAGGPGGRGLTSEEFAKELALLTTGFEEELPPPAAPGQVFAPGTRTSPRRARPAASPHSSSPVTVPPPRPSRKRPRRAVAPLSPVPEDPPFPRYDLPRDVSSPSSNTSTAEPLETSISASMNAYSTGVDENAPPLPATEAGPVEPQRKRASQSRAKYTPEEAKRRRKEQDAARAIKRRAAAKEEKERAADRVETLEKENGELRSRCEALERRVRELQGQVETLQGQGQLGRGGTSRRGWTGVGLEGRAWAGRGDGGDGGDDDSESDGGEYQVQSSEESSSDESDDDPAEAAQDAAAYLRDVAAELDSLTDMSRVTSTPYQSTLHSIGGEGAPMLDLATLGSDGLS